MITSQLLVNKNMRQFGVAYEIFNIRKFNFSKKNQPRQILKWLKLLL